APGGAASAAASDEKIITGTVRLAPELAARVAPDDVLYIFARGEGSRMPLAIVRLKASELSRPFRLDDTQSMMAGRTLSSAPQVRVEARISKSGDAMPSAGDLRGETPLIAPGARNVVIVISEVIAAPAASTATAAPTAPGGPAATPATSAKTAASPATPTAKGSPAKTAASPTAPTIATAPPMSAPAPVATAGKAITGIVKLAPMLAAQVAPNDTLFVFARAAEGPRMPVAILRLKASELPKQFRLDDTLGMAGGPTLSTVPQVRIEARVSKSGEALPKPGDLRGESAVVAPGAANVEVIIDRVLP
ncbi:MAG: hypothetical protein ABI831_14215, partial [Betaproteobacteria bacterium]